MKLQKFYGQHRRHTNGALLAAADTGQDCCCGYDPPPPLYLHWRSCASGALTQWTAPPTVGDVLYSFRANQCLYQEWPEDVNFDPGTPISDELGVDYTVVPFCDHRYCRDPPDPPPPPPPPDECDSCSTLAVCTHCHCTPNGLVRVAISGTQNCICIGPCGFGPSWAYARLRDGETLDGVYEMFSIGPCEWQTYPGLTLAAGDAAAGGCFPSFGLSVTLHLKKLNNTKWVFSAYVNTMADADPRDYYPGTTNENFRFFSGESTVHNKTCTTVPTMTNQLTCVCESQAGQDGRFALTTGGQAVFNTCPAG